MVIHQLEHETHCQGQTPMNWDLNVLLKDGIPCLQEAV
jgi:hypothetical protein